MTSLVSSVAVEDEDGTTRLSAWPGFDLPDLSGIAGETATGLPSEELVDAVYHDAKDLRLLRAGITVCRRRGTSPGWTVELPIPDPAVEDGLEERRVVHLDVPDEHPPAPVLSLVRASLRGADLVAVARLQTRRRRVELQKRSAPVAVIDDDEISVLDGERVAARFREVQLTVGHGAPAGLREQVLEGLVGAGAGPPDPTPTLVRALGPRALRPPDLVARELPERPTVREVLGAALERSVLRIVRHDPVIRLDLGLEGVHQARVGSRRLRSDLRTFRRLLRGGEMEPLRDELSWLGRVLGDVRDADVLLAHLRASVSQLGREVDREAAAALLGQLAAQREEAQARAVAALDEPRYVVLLERLVELCHEPPLKEKQADRDAAKVLARLVARPYRRLARDVASLPDVPADEDLHRVRIRAKRARYAAEVAAPVVGRPASRLARALRGLQDELGEHQDAVVAEAWLRDAAAHAPPEQAMAAGLLISADRARAEAHRETWREAWASAARPKAAGWLP